MTTARNTSILLCWVTILSSATTAIEEILFSSNFENGEDGFHYREDIVSSVDSNIPDYASGSWVKESFTGSNAALQVFLGGVDNDDIHELSAGWQKPITMEQTGTLQVTLDYQLEISQYLESGEYGQVVIFLDGNKEVVEELRGNGDGGKVDHVSRTGHVMTWSNVEPGRHWIVLGAYANRKTYINEWVRVQFDNVVAAITNYRSDHDEETIELPQSQPPQPTPRVTYRPGDLTVTLRDGNGRRVLVSQGMNGKTICGGGNGQRRCHCAADAGACFPDPANNDRFYYVSNGECGSGGGVWSFHFDNNGSNLRGDGESIKVLRGTRNNCGGGKTPWNTWLSSEEDGSSGRVWEVDPTATSATGYQTDLVDKPSNYESNVYYEYRDGSKAFFTTDDRDVTSSNGHLVRCNIGNDFSPRFGGLRNACRSYSFLVLHQDNTYTFSNSRRRSSVSYDLAEGIDVAGTTLYFTTKGDRHLYELDLEGTQWSRSSTRSGAFNHQPDQIKSILGDNGNDDNILYFCEDGGNDCGVHGRDSDGNFFTILDGAGYKTETTGLAFSPDGTKMFVSFQDYAIWMFWREDGFPFGGTTLDIKYHEK